MRAVNRDSLPDGAADRPDGAANRPDRGHLGLRRRVIRLAKNAAWVARHPVHSRGSAEWFLQEVRLSRPFWPNRYAGGTIRRMPPLLLAKHSQPLVDPVLVSAEDADHMRPNDVVVGLALDGSPRAYPWWILDNHHVANDVVGGTSVALVFCERCSTAIALDPRVDGRRLIFQQGHLYNGTVALEDRETRSVWAPYLGMAIRGRLRGTRLELLPLFQMEWAAWRRRHPDTLVLEGSQGSRTGHGSDHGMGTSGVGRGMGATLARLDERLPHNALVLGVLVPGVERAYPLDALRANDGVVNDRQGETPLVVLADMAAGSYAALAFSRWVDGRELTFDAGPKGISDRETGTTWTTEGRAVAGPLAGTSLRFVPSHVSEWYVWPAHYPSIDIAALP